MPNYSTINLHPASFLPSELAEKTFDVICIGSGWSANVVAGRMSKAGLTVLIVEAELFGGDCPFWACVPSKALLRPGDALAEAKDVQGAAERLDSAKEGPDADNVFARRDRWTSKWDDEKVIVKYYQSVGASLVRGWATIVGEKKVSVENVNGEKALFEARKAVIIGTGSTATIPDTPGLADANPWTPRQATSTSKVPEHLIVIGAGAVGCEMASLFATLGGKCTILIRGQQILPRVDPEAAEVVQKRFQEQGIDVVNSARITKVVKMEGGKVQVELENHEPIQGTEILVAAGRKARLANIGLENLGIDVNQPKLATDESLCVTSVSENWLYAGGDVNGRSPLSHGAKYHGRVIAQAILEKSKEPTHQIKPWSRTAATGDLFAVPQVVFTRPNVASVGLTRRTATKGGVKFREATTVFKTLGSQLRSDRQEDGWAQWIIEDGTERLLGATFAGDDAADLLHASTVAIVGNMTVSRLAHAVPSFPTMSEVYLNLIEAAGY